MDNMFNGTSFHSLDAKGRMKIPSRFRDMVRSDGSDKIIISSLDGGLVAYTPVQWQDIESKILSMAEKSDSMRRFRRFFIGGASECVCDKQERVLIPPLLRDYANIDKEIVLVGVLDHFEIWSKKNYDNQGLMLEEDLKKEDVRNDIAKLGL